MKKDNKKDGGAPQLLAHHPEDNVGVVVDENLAAGTDMRCAVVADNSEFRLVALDGAPIGHKIALCDLRPGDAARKYGQDIGRITAPVKKGGHVHVHNLKTNRW